MMDLRFRDWEEDRHICHFIGAGTATLLGAGISAGGAATSGKKGASAATQAAQIQAQAQMASLALQQQIRQQNVQELQPFIDYGQGGIDQLKAFVSGPGSAPIDTTLPSFTFQPTQAQLEQVPGYQFEKAQALDAEQANLLAMGRGPGSATAAGAASRAASLASTDWQSIYNQQQSQYQTNINSLLAGRTMNLQQKQQIANILNQRVGGVGLPAAGALAGANLASGQAIGSAITGAGAAQASGVVGAANALSGATTAGANALGGGLQQYALLNALGSGGMSSFNQPYTAAGGYGWGPSSGTSLVG
jgi:hypothetical protein